MATSVENQAIVFLIFIICGAVIGLLFDFFRIIRKLISTGVYLTFFHDVMFCLISLIVYLLFSFKFNYGQQRWYMFFGVILGSWLYFLTISKFIIVVSVTSIKLFFNLLLIPLKIILKIFKKPLIVTLKFGKIRLKRLKNKILPFKKYINMLKKRKNMV